MSLTPLRCDVLVTGPGPLGGGSVSGQVRCAHMPEKSGMGVAVCAHAGAAHAGSAAAIAAIAKKRTNKRKSCRDDVMISSRARRAICGPARASDLDGGLAASVGASAPSHKDSIK
jgi:hypothetical protein